MRHFINIIKSLLTESDEGGNSTSRNSSFHTTGISFLDNINGDLATLTSKNTTGLENYTGKWLKLPRRRFNLPESDSQFRGADHDQSRNVLYHSEGNCEFILYRGSAAFACVGKLKDEPWPTHEEYIEMEWPENGSEHSPDSNIEFVMFKGPVHTSLPIAHQTLKFVEFYVQNHSRRNTKPTKPTEPTEL